MDDTGLGGDPLEQLRSWVERGRKAVPHQDAMTLATATTDGKPSVRVVLLRGIDGRGLTFFTNRTSRKAEELRLNPQAAAVIHWWELGRQARIEGEVEETSDEDSYAYWITRPRGSQLAAWASRQSQPLSGREELDARVGELAARFEGAAVPLPPFWGGYRIVPASIELWTHRDDRLHDRIHYVRGPGGWRAERLFP